MDNDHVLLVAIGQGCTESYCELYTRYKDRIHRYAHSRVQDYDSAGDILQETFLTVWKTAKSFAGKSTVSTWLFGIAVNKAREQRRQQRQDVLPLTAASAALVAPDFTTDSDTRLTVLEAMQSLPEEQQEVVLLAYYAGLPYVDIAAIQSVPVGTVKSRMSLAKKTMLSKLQRSDV